MSRVSSPPTAAISSIPLAGRRTISVLPLLDGYLLREIAGPFFFAFGAFFLFWGVNVFFVALDFLINAHAPFFLVVRFVLFRVPQAIPLAFPFATLFATLLAMGRFSGDNELNAFRTSGIPLWRICVTPILFGTATFLCAYYMNEDISPASLDLSQRTFYQIIYHTASIPVEPQFFRKDPDTGNEFYVTQVLPDKKTMAGVQVFKPGRAGYFNEVDSAKTARVEGDALLLSDVVITRYTGDGAVAAQVRDSHISVGLPLGESAAQFISQTNTDSNSMSSKTLGAQVKSMQTQGAGGSMLGTMQVNLANKSAYPFACLIAVLIALPLAIRFGKRGRTLGIALSILVFAAYDLLSLAASAFGRNGAVNPYVASWTPNLLFGLAGLALLWWEEH